MLAPRASCWVADLEAKLLIRRLQYFLSNNLLEPRVLLPAHALSIVTGNSQNKFLASKLIESYAFIGQKFSSTRIFDSLGVKDVFLWNSIIKAYFSTGNYGEAVDLFARMRFSADAPNQFTLPMIITACAELGFLSFGACTHSLILKLNLFHDNTAVGASLVYMYSKCGSVGSASLVFDEMSTRDGVAWTALLIGYVQNGENEKGLQCLREMHRTGDDCGRVNFRTLEGGLQACANSRMLAEGRCLHGLTIKSGIASSHMVQSAILLVYSKCGDVEDAWLSFVEVVKKDLFSFTSIIGVYSRLGWIKECVQIFLSMRFHSLYPDGMVISCLVAGFSNSMNTLEGRALHGFIMRRNYFDYEIVSSSLLSMYLKFDLLAFAEHVFMLVKNHEMESWNLMIVGYEKAGLEVNCLNLFREQQRQGIKSNSNSLISVVSSCSRMGAVLLSRSVHGHIFRNLLFQNVCIVNSLITMYGKCGYLSLAERLFHQTTRDIASWSCLISSYADNGNPLKAISLFDEMISDGLKPDTKTLLTLLSACAHLASAEEGRKLHHYIEKKGLLCEASPSLGTALVDMYAKCGEIDMAREIFNAIDGKDIVSWNVMISCYGMHGYGKTAIEIFHQMEEEHEACPNSLTFLAVLSACVHSGLLDKARALFAKMEAYFIEPSMKHYACMVDLYGRQGLLDEAEGVISSMPFSPDGGMWGSLLSACKMHNDVYMGMKIAKRAIEADPSNDGYYILLSDFYSSLEMWEEVEKMRQIIKDKGLRKTLGWSCV